MKIIRILSEQEMIEKLKNIKDYEFSARCVAFLLENCGKILKAEENSEGGTKFVVDGFDLQKNKRRAT